MLRLSYFSDFHDVFVILCLWQTHDHKEINKYLFLQGCTSLHVLNFYFAKRKTNYTLPNRERMNNREF